MTYATGVGRGRSGDGVIRMGRGPRPLPMPASVAERGACLTTDVDMTPSPPVYATSGPNDAEWEAIKVCLECPPDVGAACRAWGIADPTVGGVVGGLTERERAQERRRAG